jgi:hypothetical protein
MYSLKAAARPSHSGPRVAMSLTSGFLSFSRYTELGALGVSVVVGCCAAFSCLAFYAGGGLLAAG